MVAGCPRREVLLVIALGLYACVFLWLLPATDTEDTAPALGVNVEQVHVAYGPGDEKETSMFVSWTLGIPAEECRLAVWSASTELSLQVVRPFSRIWRGVQYRAVLSSLAYDQDYTYSISCSSGSEQSGREFAFRTNPGLRDAVEMIILGDWATAAVGDANNPQHTRIPKANILAPLLQERNYSGIWHLGDIAYDLFSNRGSRGDSFLRSIQPLAAHSAYMTVVGNHELGHFFQDFMQRFPAPGHGLYWSLGIGKAQMIAFSSEFDYNRMKPGIFPKDQSFLEKLGKEQKDWLQQELRKAEENRRNRPWVVVMAHKPLYCSLNSESEMIMTVCGLQAKIMREVYEDVLLQSKVDLLLFGHVHLYERLLPTAHDEVIGAFSANDTVFINPKAPIHVINGVAGNLENESIVMKVTKTPGKWTAVMSESLGYGRLNIVNSTHLHYVQYAFGKTQFDDFREPLVRRVEDEFWIVKT